MSHEPQERDAIATRRATRIGVVAVVIALLATWWSVHMDHGGAPQIPRQADLGAAPAVIESSLIGTASSAADLAAQQRHMLASWEWIDREHGIARIPVDEAIDAYLKQRETK